MQTSSLLLFAVLVTVLSSFTTSAMPSPDVTNSEFEGIMDYPRPPAVPDFNREVKEALKPVERTFAVMREIVSSIPNDISSGVTKAANAVVATIKKIGEEVSSFVTGVGSGIKKGIKATGDWIGDVLKSIF